MEKPLDFVMIKLLTAPLLFLLLAGAVEAQQPDIDRLRRGLLIAENDTAKLVMLSLITEAYNEIRPDSTLYFAEELLALSRKLKLRLNEAYALDQKAYAYLNMGNYPNSLQTYLAGLSLAEDPESEENVLPQHYLLPNRFLKPPVSAHTQRLVILARITHYIGILYGTTNNFKRELYYYFKAKDLTEQVGNLSALCPIYSTMGRAYLSLKNTDSALICEQNSYDLAMSTGYKKYLGSILLNFGRIQATLGNKKDAIGFFRRAVDTSIEQKYLRGAVASYLQLAELYKGTDKQDSVFDCIKSAFELAKYQNVPSLLLRCYGALSGYYASLKKADSVIKYQGLIIKLNDSIFNSKQTQLFQTIDFDEEKRRQEQIVQQKEYASKIRIYLLATALAIVFLVAFLLYRNNRRKKLANALLTRQKEKVEQALKELRNTQNQLIQSEKMASLGQLTAGIAHEIQNPLNFVNNFSDLNVELIEEMNVELKVGNPDAAANISRDISQNEQKINYHGKRADIIVKSMLQHSQGKGVIELTDVNALAEEYLKLAYHGFRAKDKSMSSALGVSSITIRTDFDPFIGEVYINAQDIGRVCLSLYNNAFYAVASKKNQRSDPFEPVVLVSTKLVDHHVEMRVKDNGVGIPPKNLDKIFNPFFTTKPTGEGTGLGLSLAYDIVKAHAGELTVTSVEGEGSEFVIRMPVKR